MRHPLIILFCFSFLSIFMAHGQSENEKSKGDSFLFSFIPGEADIQATYGNNSIEMERLNRKIWPVMNPLMDGEFHVLIVSHIYTETGAVSKTAVNTAMWRGNTVRKYLKNKYELDNKQISFYVDRSGSGGIAYMCTCFISLCQSSLINRSFIPRISLYPLSHQA